MRCCQPRCLPHALERLPYVACTVHSASSAGTFGGAGRLVQAGWHLTARDRVSGRQLYPFVGETLLPSRAAKLTSAQLVRIKDRLCALAPTAARLDPSNLILHRVTMSYGTAPSVQCGCTSHD